MLVCLPGPVIYGGNVPHEAGENSSVSGNLLKFGFEEIRKRLRLLHGNARPVGKITRCRGSIGAQIFSEQSTLRFCLRDCASNLQVVGQPAVRARKSNFIPLT